MPAFRALLVAIFTAIAVYTVIVVASHGNAAELLMETTRARASA